MSKLKIITGVSGSGKSTFASWFTETRDCRRIVDEADHPANWEKVHSLLESGINVLALIKPNHEVEVINL